MEIPPPITEENKDRYLEELSKIIEADDWIERHSIENKSNQDVNKTEQQHRDLNLFQGRTSIICSICD